MGPPHHIQKTRRFLSYHFPMRRGRKALVEPEQRFPLNAPLENFDIIGIRGILVHASSSSVQIKDYRRFFPRCRLICFWVYDF